MKFTVKKQDVVDALSKIQGICSKKTSSVITTCVLIRVEKDRIYITANDFETGFEGYYPADVESEGVIAINARKLYEIVKDFPVDEILVTEVENFWIEIGRGNIQFNMVGMNPDDFTNLPCVENASFFTMDSSLLKKMIERTQIISAGDDKKPHTQGICLQRVTVDEKTVVRMLSTDGNRLSKAECVLSEKVNMDDISGILILKKGIGEMTRILIPGKPIDIAIENNNAFFRQENETTVIRLLEGAFPEYSDYITWPDARKIRVNTKACTAMLKRMSILSSDDYKAVVFTLFEDKMTIRSTNPELGESREEVQIDYQGDSLEVAFNPRYMIEALGLIEDEYTILHITSGQTPCLIEGETDKSYLNVIMPMRI